MMKKATWGLLALLIGQPIVIYTAQRALLTTIPSRYGLLGAIAYTSDPHHYLAMLESALIPALLIALKPLNRYAAPYTWSTILKRTLGWWLFGMNLFILISLFVQASWLSWGIFLWSLGGAMVLLAKLLGVLSQ
ncbi:hypothetical protein EQG59_07415 [Lactiplantibacillus plantarum]|nr:hypothetical protein EQJ27_07415 [Lactiplantibacillus plantarum]RWZ07957.1 hypothetical protein EQG51_07415 [Lactiplantibacillus plantarum]RWZ35798.1 hypothetical protein EQG59_07415 [Lactiplantibacillus plantarum]